MIDAGTLHLCAFEHGYEYSHRRKTPRARCRPAILPLLEIILGPAFLEVVFAQCLTRVQPRTVAGRTRLHVRASFVLASITP